MFIQALLWSCSRRDMCTLSPLCLFRHPLSFGWSWLLLCDLWYRGLFFALCSLIVAVGMGGGGGVGEKGVGMVIWGTYLKSFSPSPSSHWGRYTLIRCAGTRDPRRQR